MAEISIIVPVYKVESYLTRCVDSILAQTFTDFEIILVDDGSPDRCGRICDEYARTDARIRVIHRQNGGLSAARNTGIESAFADSSSRWLTFIDSDDWIHPRYLEILHTTALRHNVSVSVVRHVRRKEKGQPAGPDLNRDDQKKTDSSVIAGETDTETAVEICTARELLLKHPWDYNYAWGKLYDRKLFRSLRYPEGKNFEDTFTTYKALYEGSRIAWIDRPLYYYFYNTEGISSGRWTPSELVILEGMRQQMDFYREIGWEDAFLAEEKLYIHHHAYQMNRIRQNRTDLKQNRPYLIRLRKEMLELLRGNPARYGIRQMPYCYEAAWPKLAGIYHMAGRLCRRLHLR